MTEYADIPAVNALHHEAELAQQALDVLAAGGSLSNFTVAPPPPAPEAMPSVMMAVMVGVPSGTTSEGLATSLQSWLTQRLADIAAELTAYGVTSPPEAMSASKKKER